MFGRQEKECWKQRKGERNQKNQQEIKEKYMFITLYRITEQ